MRHNALILIGLFLLGSFSPLFAKEETGGESLPLKEAVQQALANNLNLTLLRQDVTAAQGAILSEKGRFDALLAAGASRQSRELTPLAAGGAKQEDTGLWELKLTKPFSTGTVVSLGWNNNFYDSDIGGLLFNPSYQTGFSLEIRQPLLKGFGREVQNLGLTAARKKAEALTFKVNSQAANLAANVKRAYWSLVFAWQDIGVRKLSLTLAKKLLAETEAKIKAGKLAQVERYQPQSEVARREERLISAERAIGTAEDELKLLLNNEQWLTTFKPTDRPTTKAVTLNSQKILTNALQNRPDIKAADLSVQIAELEKRRAKDNSLPDLSLQGKIGSSSSNGTYGNAVDDSISDPDNSWQIGITFSMPIANSVARGYSRQAEARYNMAKTSAKLLRQQVRKTVRATIRDIKLAVKSLEATRKTSLATKKRLEAEQAKFQSGRATTLDVLIAQDAYSRALSQENFTAVSYANSLAELDRIQGLVTYSSSR